MPASVSRLFGFRESRATVACAIIVGAGWLLRAAPLALFGPSGAFADYDSGAYFASAAALVKGALPYRDFVYVHPPGFLYFLLPAASLSSMFDPAIGFAAARWLSTLVGALNILLIARLTGRLFGASAALAAAALYAFSPIAAGVERGVTLEPVLNALFLLLAHHWLHEGENPIRHSFLAGAALALAVSTKLTGALWLFPCLASLPGCRRASLRAFAGGGAIVSVLMLALPLLSAPGSFVVDTVLFHLWRPAAGLDPLGRMGQILGLTPGRFAAGLLPVAGVVLAWGRRPKPNRALVFFSLAYLVVAASLFCAPVFWDHYLAQLLPPGAVLGGFAFSVLRGGSRRRRAIAAVALAVACLASLVATVRSNVRAPWVAATSAVLRTLAPGDAAVFAFEPAWALACGRLPAMGPSASIIADPYGDMLLAAVMSGDRFPSDLSAFHSPASQRRLREVLLQARFVVIGPRGWWQMTPDTVGWLRAHFLQRAPGANVAGLDVWERRSEADS